MLRRTEEVAEFCVVHPCHITLCHLTNCYHKNIVMCPYTLNTELMLILTQHHLNHYVLLNIILSCILSAIVDIVLLQTMQV